MTHREGQQIGHYRLLTLLGRGGFAEVYLGEHLYLKTSVAVKLLHAHFAQKDISAFLEEAQTIAHLHHPHIVQVTDFGIDTTEQETPYLVMTYAPLGTLHDRHSRGSRVALPTVISYVSQLAAALDYAHQQKRIHRDVKPENMLLSSDHHLLLSDFGIAAIAHSTSSFQTQAYAGTVPYSAPEQIHGKPVPASDQYAVAVVVYEWLMGKWPFHGSPVEIMMQHLSTPPPPLSGMPPAVELVVQKALAKKPEERFVTVAAFAQALEEASYETQRATRVELPPDPSRSMASFAPQASLGFSPSITPVHRSANLQSPEHSFTESAPPVASASLSEAQEVLRSDHAQPEQHTAVPHLLSSPSMPARAGQPQPPLPDTHVPPAHPRSLSPGDTSSRPKSRSRWKFLVILLVGIGCYFVSFLPLLSFMEHFYPDYYNGGYFYLSSDNLGYFLIGLAVLVLLTIAVEIVVALFIFRRQTS